MAYNATFLRSVGWRYAGKVTNDRGHVWSAEGDLLYVLWQDGHGGYVNKHNLVCTDAPGGLQADAERCKIRGYNESYDRFEL